jgi:hypothetical protein
MLTQLKISIQNEVKISTEIEYTYIFIYVTNQRVEKYNYILKINRVAQEQTRSNRRKNM